MYNFIYLLNDYKETSDLCADLAPALRIVGVVYKGIQIVVPIILIIVGMLDFAKAVTEKDEKDIKAAQKRLIQKAIAAVVVFLITVVVGILMRIVGNDDYKGCMECITRPFQGECRKMVEQSQKEFNY